MLDQIEHRTVHCVVAGRVQGVGFRASTQRRASQLGLTGWVRNLADGRVELVATGTPEQVDRLVDWLAGGPEQAVVEALDVVVAATTLFEGFDIRID
jgi:acylphosphatase